MPLLSWMIAGCSEPAPNYHPPEDADLSFATGWVLRVEDDACGFEPRDETIPGVGANGAITFDSRFRMTSVEITSVDIACAETSELVLGPGESDFIGLAVYGVARVYTEDGDLLSAWELLFADGGTVVLQ